MARSAEQVKIQVIVDDEHLTRISEVVERLEAAGVRSVQRFDTIGIVAGAVSPSDLAHVSAVKGVSGVEQARDVQVLPSESKVQ